MSANTSKELIITSREAADYKYAGMLFFISGAVYLFFVMAGEASYPRYSVHANSLSDLGAIGTNTAVFYDPATFVWGLFWFLGAYFLFRNHGKRGLMVLNLLPGVGILLVAIFPENVNIVIHSIGSAIGGLIGGVVAILSSRIIKSDFRYLALFLGALSLVGAFIEFGTYNSAFFQQSLGPGGWERLLVYPLLIWLIAFGSYLTALGKPNEGIES